MYPIYIPSKGRHDVGITAAILMSESLPFYVVVEPQVYREYSGTLSETSVLKLPKNNQGIAYVRNFIKRHSTQAGDKWHWQLDDDIKAFKRRQNDRNVPSCAKYVLTAVEKEIAKYDNIGIAALKHDAFAFAAKTDISTNQQACGAVLVNNDVNIRWNTDTIDDTDYSMQVLSRGFVH